MWLLLLSLNVFALNFSLSSVYNTVYKNMYYKKVKTYIKTSFLITEETLIIKSKYIAPRLLQLVSAPSSISSSKYQFLQVSAPPQLLVFSH